MRALKRDVAFDLFDLIDMRLWIGSALRTIWERYLYRAVFSALLSSFARTPSAGADVLELPCVS
jgi:hypothetical protein